MWAHWISFRHMVNSDFDEQVLKGNLVHLLSNVIAHQPSQTVRVVTSKGVKIISRSESGVSISEARKRSQSDARSDARRAMDQDDDEGNVRER